MWTCRCENRRAEDCESTVRIAALVEQVENLTKERNDLQDKCNNFAEKCRAAIAECDEVTKDAMRYRHMRTNGKFQDRNGPGIYWYLPHFDRGLPIGRRLDSAIDADRGEVK